MNGSLNGIVQLASVAVLICKPQKLQLGWKGTQVVVKHSVTSDISQFLISE
jgi:hypothetical protein